MPGKCGPQTGNEPVCHLLLVLSPGACFYHAHVWLGRVVVGWAAVAVSMAEQPPPCHNAMRKGDGGGLGGGSDLRNTGKVVGGGEYGGPSEQLHSDAMQQRTMSR